MIQIALTLCVMLASLAFIQGCFALGFVSLFRRRSGEIVDADLPKASILLSLRGADPNLAKGLRCLMSQNYPDYDLRIVVDQEGDPSWNVVQDAISESGFERVYVSAMQNRPEVCSLKCSALVQLASQLKDDCEVVVLADADLVSHADWMRVLIAPLTEQGIGATHGNRWFWPAEARWGSLVRYLWNAAAVVPMHLFGIPWGGTFAMRASLLRESGLLEKWSRAVVEDAPVRSALEEQGLAVRFIPELMMVNREECDLPFSLDFIKRQLTWTKIYHPRWAFVALHAFVTTGVLLATALMIPAAFVFGLPRVSLWAACGLSGYLLAMILLLAILEMGVRKVVRERGEETMSFPPIAQARLVLAIPLTQCIHAIATLLATFRRHVAWRGVTYHVRGPWDVRMVGYQPFEQTHQPIDSNTSL